MFKSIVFILLLLVSNIGSAQIRIGYFGGSFDPPHLGHVELVRRAIEAANLDIVYIFPSIVNSHKPDISPYSIRKILVQEAFSDEAKALLPDEELERAFLEGRAAAVLRILVERHQHAKIFRITGDDVIARNYTTHMTEDSLLANIGMIIGKRGGKNKDKAEDIKSFNFEGREVIILPEDIGYSSTMTKEKMKNGASEETLPISRKVLNQIKKMGMYNYNQCPKLFFSY